MRRCCGWRLKQGLRYDRAFLPEHVRAVRAGERLAQKEAEHLRYSLTTLFALPIDLFWVQALAQQPELAEKVEAFVPLCTAARPAG